MAQKRRNKLALKHPLILAGLVVFVLLITGWVIHKNAHQTPRQSQPSATIKQLSSQPAVNGGEKEITGNSTGGNQGTATDNSGQSTTPVTSNPSQWLSSASGSVTVRQPLSGSTIADGVTVSGAASVSKIQYRLTDDQVGVISQGFINVVNGNFSASIGFRPTGHSGRLDVFSTDSGGVEINEVQVPVKY